MIVKKEILFKATKEKVWDLLTNPEMTKQYMFGCEVLSSWKKGDPILWKGKTEDGKEVIYVKGVIGEINVGEKLSFSMFDPNMGIEDIPENYVNLTYELEEDQEGTLLKLSQGDFAGVAQSRKRYEDTVKGWEMVLPLMKELLEP
ncbi:hypothetical protein GWK08_14615 [Leptobacterium flavescens]|uniref:Activator of Hsp90 ATPase homologue 1/2-like C-terminal domain-containing protein n=1 Tax=Leptobacterium flavescens TaxID=472055 RepID=A0A6P0UW79_9FLAO|nr:SRPBCC domain-containing protein [Leptobacterium flavescens]NER14686.1 hypothetical protein [Leptobacterium flavescens]